MRRRELSDEELDKIIGLRQIGASWLKIQHEIRIDRRTAKHAYDKWERSKSIKELKEARKVVAAQVFREHMDSLVTLATSLVMQLSVPHLPNMIDKNGEQFSSWLFEQDLLQRGDYLSSEPIHVYAMGDEHFHRREQELLFKSLQDHTRGEVRWKSWDEWKEARSSCVRVLDRLRKETSEVVNNFVNQERQTNFLQRTKEESRLDDPVKRMEEVVLKEIWRAILRDKLDEEGTWFQTVSGRMGPPEDMDIYVKSRDEKVFTFIGNTNKGLAERVTRICNLTANNLCKGDMIQQLRDEVRRMKKASEELREMLNPVKLRPIILRTQCELCPA